MDADVQVPMAPENTFRRYRSRPVECEALQFDPSGAHRMRLPDGVTGVPSPGADHWDYKGCKFYVTVQVGQHFYRQELKPRDWLVRTDDGNWRTCPDAVFKRGFMDVSEKVSTPAASPN